MLGGIGNESPAAVGQSLVGSYAAFPCVKRAFICESGSVTTEMIDVVTGARLASMPWTMTSPFSSYMNVLNETVHHNIDLAAGSWPQPGENISLWLICGKFDGNFSFGFGDSTPNNIEIVLTQFTGVSIVATIKTPIIGGGSLVQQNVPNYVAGRYTPSTMQAGTTSLVGLLVNGRESLTLFYTDASGVYHEVTEVFEDIATAFNPPATYSIGRDVVTSGGLSGIVDLRLINVVEFANGLPPTYKEDLTELSANFAAGRKVFPANWKGRS